MEPLNVLIALHVFSPPPSTCRAGQGQQVFALLLPGVAVPDGSGDEGALEGNEGGILIGESRICLLPIPPGSAPPPV